MTSPTEAPRTAAGRLLVDDDGVGSQRTTFGSLREAVLAIEAQARRDAVADAFPAPDVVAVKKVLDRIVANDLAFGKPLTTEYPSRAMLRNDVKELAALLFGDSFHHLRRRTDDEGVR